MVSQQFVSKFDMSYNLISKFMEFVFLLNSSYRDFREPYDSVDKFEFTKTYYYVLVARLAFLVIFEVKKFLNFLKINGKC